MRTGLIAASAAATLTLTGCAAVAGGSKNSVAQPGNRRRYGDDIAASGQGPWSLPGDYTVSYHDDGKEYAHGDPLPGPATTGSSM
jgi:hypothetical protein